MKLGFSKIAYAPILSDVKDVLRLDISMLDPSLLLDDY
jgi:hypothetical protein